MSVGESASKWRLDDFSACPVAMQLEVQVLIVSEAGNKRHVHVELGPGECLEITHATWS